jgi:hypothetical protein
LRFFQRATPAERLASALVDRLRGLLDRTRRVQKRTRDHLPLIA